MQSPLLWLVSCLYTTVHALHCEQMLVALTCDRILFRLWLWQVHFWLIRHLMHSGWHCAAGYTIKVVRGWGWEHLMISLGNHLEHFCLFSCVCVCMSVCINVKTFDTTLTANTFPIVFYTLVLDFGCSGCYVLHGHLSLAVALEASPACCIYDIFLLHLE